MTPKTYKKRMVGDRALRPETLMIGYGYSPALSEGSLKPPIFLTSTFVFETAQQGTWRQRVPSIFVQLVM